MDAEQAYVTLSVSGADQRIAITENATAATLYLMRPPALDASTVKLLHKGKRLARDDALTPGMRVLCLGTTTQQKQAIAAQRSDPTIRGFKAEAQREAARRGAVEELQPSTPSTSSVGSKLSNASTGDGPHRFEAEKLPKSWRRVAPIMVSHAWTVGGLLEMDPQRRPNNEKKAAGGRLSIGLQRKHGRTDLRETQTGRRFSRPGRLDEDVIARALP